MLQPVVYDMIVLLLILGVTYALASEGVWGAALMFFNIMFAGLISFNFYETLARLWTENTSTMSGWADMICLFGVFFVSLIILRVITDMVAPAVVRLPVPVYHLGRLGFGLAGATTLMAILICGFQTAPVSRKMFGNLDYDFQPPFKLGIDRKWLAFVQWSSGTIFPYYGDEEEPDDLEYGTAKIFDRTGSWLIDHQNARPYHREGFEDTVPYPDEAPEPAAKPKAEAPAKGGG